MTTEIKPGQVWQWNVPGIHWGREFTVQEARTPDSLGAVFACTYADNPHVWTVYESTLRTQAHLVTEAHQPETPSQGAQSPLRDERPENVQTPTEPPTALTGPYTSRGDKVIDPSAVRPGDTVTIEVATTKADPSFTVTGEVTEENGQYWVGPVFLFLLAGTWRKGLTLLDHKPAEQSRPEVGTSGWATLPDGTRRFGIIDLDQEFCYLTLDENGEWLDDGKYVADYADFVSADDVVLVERGSVDVDAIVSVIEETVHADDRSIYQILRVALEELGLVDS